METIKKLLFLLTSEERKGAGVLLFMIFIMAILDMIGVASILPFMAVLTNPDLVDTNIILNNMFKTSSIFGVENTQQFLFVLGILVFLLLVISLIFKAATSYAQVRFIQMRQYTIGKRLIEGYLYQPYSWFLSRHSANLGQTILTEVAQVVGGSLNSLIHLIAKGMVTLALIILLLVNEIKLTLIVGISLCGAYGIIYYIIRNYLSDIGKKRLKSNELRFLAVSEAFGAAKEVKVGGLEQFYIKSFSDSAQTYSKTLASASVLGLLPRFFLEAIAFGGILLILLYIMKQTGNFNEALPTLSLYAFAGYRLIPALQQIYISFTSLSFSTPSLDKLYEDIKNLKPISKSQCKEILTLKKEIKLKHIHYNYPNASRTAINGVNLTIPVKSTVGIVGATGSGKTTIVDIILGLLEPQKGTLEVDERIITKQNSRAWQRLIGYVPQHIYLSDDTIEANIAFGVGSKDINQDMVEKASKIANLHQFIIDDLPEKYQTVIGERGIRLSGGQRQRIGIARALYHDPKILILDEATSALDNQTEEVVMKAVNNLSKDITTILIAHRLNTVKNCDIIFKLEKGKLIDSEKF